MSASMIELSDGSQIAVELSDVAVLEQEAGLEALPPLRELLRKVAEETKEAIDAVAPDEATVKFAVKAAAGSGGALRWIVGKLDGETTVEVVLKWTRG